MTDTRRSRARRVAGGGLLLVASAAFVLGCLDDASQRPPESGRLRLDLSWDPKVLVAKEAVPEIQRIDVQVHRAVGGTEILLAATGTEITAGQTSFHIEVPVPEGTHTSVEVAASGSIVDEDEPPEDGLLYFGRVSGLSILANEETAAAVTLSSFFPRGLAAVGDLESGYRLSWGPVVHATSYRVRLFLPDGPQDVVVTQPAIDRPADGTGLLTSRLLHRVRAENVYFAGAFSDTIGVQARLPGPPAPTHLSVNALSATSIDVAWDYPARNPDTFEVERRLSGQPAWLPLNPFPGNSRGFIDTGLTPRTTYAYRIRARLNHLYSRYAGPDSATTGTPGPPGDPSGLVASRQGASLALQWDASSGIVDSYEVYRRRMQDVAFTFFATVGGATTSFVDSAVRPARTYTYRVRAVNGAGASGFSNDAAATTTGWRRIVVGGNTPPPRRNHQGVWTNDDRRILMYGGTPSFSDLWEYNPADSSWSEVNYSEQGENPGPRSDASMAYDPLTRRAFLDGGLEGSYGGFLFDRNTNAWEAACGFEGEGYQARGGSGCLWNAGRGRFFGFGGRTMAGDSVGGTLWDQGFRSYGPQEDSCRLESSSNTPSARSNHVFVPTSATSAFLFGGVDDHGVLGDVHLAVFSTGQVIWTPISLTGTAPGPRQRADGAADDVRERVYLLGGYDMNADPHNDLWALESLSSWIPLDPGGTAGVDVPDATDGLLIVDPATGRLYHVGPAASSQEGVWLFVP